MPRLSVLFAIVAATLLAGGCAGGPSPSPPPPSAHPANGPKVSVTTEKTITLPGKGGHGDEVIADPNSHVVYIAQSPDNNLVILDTTANTVKAVVPNVASANGIAFDDNAVFVAEASSNAVAVIAKSSWQVVATVPSGGKTPDAVYFDAKQNAVYVANDDSNNMEKFDASAPYTVRGTVKLQPDPAKSGPDLGTYSAAADRIYQADDNDVLVIDPASLTIQKVITVPLPAGTATKDMYDDPAHKLLWVATSGPQAVALDPASGAVVATVKTASGADQVTADPARGLLFLGEGKAGAIGIVDLASRRNIADIKTEPDFHTLDYLPGSDLIYAYLNDSNKVDVDRVTVP